MEEGDLENLDRFRAMRGREEGTREGERVKSRWLSSSSAHCVTLLNLVHKCAQHIHV